MRTNVEGLEILSIGTQKKVTGMLVAELTVNPLASLDDLLQLYIRQ